MLPLLEYNEMGCMTGAPGPRGSQHSQDPGSWSTMWTPHGHNTSRANACMSASACCVTFSRHMHDRPVGSIDVIRLLFWIPELLAQRHRTLQLTVLHMGASRGFPGQESFRHSQYVQILDFNLI